MLVPLRKLIHDVSCKLVNRFKELVILGIRNALLHRVAHVVHAIPKHSNRRTGVKASVKPLTVLGLYTAWNVHCAVSLAQNYLLFRSCRAVDAYYTGLNPGTVYPGS